MLDHKFSVHNKQQVTHVQTPNNGYFLKGYPYPKEESSLHFPESSKVTFDPLSTICGRSEVKPTMQSTITSKPNKQPLIILRYKTHKYTFKTIAFYAR